MVQGNGKPIKTCLNTAARSVPCLHQRETTKIHQLITNNKRYERAWWHRNEHNPPAIFGEALSPPEKEIFALSIRKGGLGLKELSVKAPKEYEVSKKVTRTLLTATITIPNKGKQQTP